MIFFFLFLTRTRTKVFFFFFSSRRRHTRLVSDWSSDVCSSDLRLAPFSRNVRGAVKRGGPFLWRRARREEQAAVEAIVRATLEVGSQALVLAPEVGVVERLVDLLRRVLPEGHTVAPYHSGLGRGRAAVHEAARKGDVDVVIGTRTSALLGLARPGSICVVDEPNGAHRAEQGHE